MSNPTRLPMSLASLTSLKTLPRAPFAALLLCTLLAACGKPEPAATEKPPAAPTVNGETVTFPGQQDPATLRIVAVASTANQAVTLPGRLAWNEDRTARVYAPFAGRLERLSVQLGQSVARGQALASVSSADVGQAQADLRRAESDLALAQKTAARTHDLVDAGVLARKEEDQAQADVARANAEAARARGRIAQYGLHADQVTMGYTLSAPVAGVVVERNGNPGAELRTDVSGPALFTISDPRSLWVTLDVDETRLDLVTPGKKVALQVAAWPEQRFEATIVNVGEAVDAASRTVKVRGSVDNAERKLKAEMFVTATLQRESGALPVVPADAVFLVGERQMVFVAKGQGRFERRAVKLRSGGPQGWFVTEGLAGGERVVVGGSLFLNQLLDTAK